MDDINFKLGELSGKIDTLLGVTSNTDTKVEKLADDFRTMEKGRLTAIERKYDALEIWFKSDQTKEEKFGNKVWDIIKAFLPQVLMGIIFLIAFWLQSQ